MVNGITLSLPEQVCAADGSFWVVDYTEELHWYYRGYDYAPQLDSTASRGFGLWRRGN